jgi:hypothetical protein
MTSTSDPLKNLTDDRLLQHVQTLAADERTATAQLIAALIELDSRELYLAAGCASLFTYCTQVLRLSEHAAYGRIEAARAAHRYPLVLELLAAGEITLTTITLLAAHLTAGNHLELLESARCKSRREVERLVATLQPRASLSSSIRRLPTTLPPAVVPEVSTNAGSSDSSLLESTPENTLGDRETAESAVSSQSTRATTTPVTPDRYRIHITISADTHDKLRRAQDLMRHTVPNGDPATILDRALSLLVEQLERRKLATTTKPRALRVAVPVSPTRYIPASIRRAVWVRDDGRCAFVGTHGRCTERGFLEFHHLKAYAEGGETSFANLQLRCRAHNQYEAKHLSGGWTSSVRTELRSP